MAYNFIVDYCAKPWFHCRRSTGNLTKLKLTLTCIEYLERYCDIWNDCPLDINYTNDRSLWKVLKFLQKNFINIEAKFLRHCNKL